MPNSLIMTVKGSLAVVNSVRNMVVHWFPPYKSAACIGHQNLNGSDSASTLIPIVQCGCSSETRIWPCQGPPMPKTAIAYCVLLTIGSLTTEDLNRKSIKPAISTSRSKRQQLRGLYAFSCRMIRRSALTSLARREGLTSVKSITNLGNNLKS